MGVRVLWGVAGMLALMGSSLVQAQDVAIISQPVATANAPREKQNDAQIANIVVTANRVDIEAGQFALGRARRATVKAFAQRMVTDHSEVNALASALVSKLGITPQDSATSAELKQGGDDNLAKLQGLHGKAFDQAYVSHEVGYHQLVLDEMDDVLIPDSSSSELKALLLKVRPAFASHLQHAQMIKASLH